MPTATLTRDAYAMVRRTPLKEGGEWIDLDTLAETPGQAALKAEVDGINTPSWDTANPIQRVARVRIIELEVG